MNSKAVGVVSQRVWRFFALAIVALSVMGVTDAWATRPAPTNVTTWAFNPPPANGQYYRHNEDIFIQIEFDRPITVTNLVSGVSPYLALALYPQDPAVNRAGYYDAADNILLLNYKVLPGDYARPLTYTSGGLIMNGAVIYETGGDPVTDAWRPLSGPLPDPAGPAGLAVRNLRIQTVTLNPGTTNVVAGETTAQPWRVNRGGSSTNRVTDVTLSLSDPSVATFIGSSDVTIPIGQQQVSFSLQGGTPGTTWVIASPVDYPVGEGVVSNLFTVTAPTNQYLVIEAIDGQPLPPYAEGSSVNWRVRRVGGIGGPLTVNLSFLDDSPSTDVIALPTTVTIQSGQLNSSPFQIQARDGTYRANVTATDPGGNYNPGTATIDVSNLDPTITGGSVSPASVTIRATVTASYTATDVLVDRSKLTGTWNWGDGQTTTGVAPGSQATHEYMTPGDYTVTLTVSDTDGGVALATYPITVTPGKTLTVNIRAPGEEGLANVGSGVVLFTPPAPVTNLVNAYTISVQYPDTQNSVVLTALADQPDTGGFTNYVFQIVGDGLSEAAQIQRGGTTSSVSVQVTLQEDSTAEVLFSREWRQGDGRGDIDGDGLTDFWELQWGLNPLVGSGNNGSGGSPSGDRMPKAGNVVFDMSMTGPDGEPYGGPFAYPITWSPGGGLSYAPVGPRFNNILQFRGQTIPITDADFPGTDPTVSDTSSDGLTDGWLYYFWANAVNDTNFTGRAFDPTSMTNSLVLSNAVIRYLFNPRFNRGLSGLDPDGDGLLTSEEYALGTNPIDWDTDGDGLPDGWEVYYETEPLDPLDARLNPDKDFMAAIVDADGNDVFIHSDVLNTNGFDPRTGWKQGGASTTREFRTIDEFAAMNWLQAKSIAAFAASTNNPPPLVLGPLDWPFYSTDPLSADTDGDGCPDGWERYVGMNPTDTAGGRRDGSMDFDLDGLLNNAEFSCQEAAALYADVGLFPMLDPGWLNKFWPTDPHNEDTDEDQLMDGMEATFSQYTGEGAGVMGPSRLCYSGGGLNPNSADTDGDYLPDYWESQFTGSVVAGNRTGMDGTFEDAFADYDNDGLANYQEYLTGAVYSFQMDKWFAVTSVGSISNGMFDTGDFFKPVEDGGYGRQAKDWDPATAWAQEPKNLKGPYFFMLAEARPSPLELKFACTSPLLWDSDSDAMDDYYEMYHGLNPLWSMTVDLVGTTLDHPMFRETEIQNPLLYPWAVGDQLADPDQDGIPNFEEMLMPNRPDPQNHHTDPTPLWMTDMSYSDSFVNLYYAAGPTLPPFWWEDVPVNPTLHPPSYMFSFESNEGYDTDNDNRSDKAELIGSDGSGSTDPLNHLSPMTRKALYLDGHAAARTRSGFTHGTDDLRSWTVELWIRPEETATGTRQIIIERPMRYQPGSPLPVPPDSVVRNFRLGFEADGRLFTECDNFGVTNLLTVQARTTALFVQTNEWTHVAGVMDGTAKTLSLYVNGALRQRVPTAGIPATGIFEGQPGHPVIAAPIVLGAADANPDGIIAGGPAYYDMQPALRPMVGQPSLHDFYRGFLDEVRIWNGIRTEAEINATMNKAFGKAEVMMYAPAYVTSNATAAAVLFYHYNFNTLPDPNHEPITPTDFADLNGRPDMLSGYIGAIYTGIPWWENSDDKSSVYTNYNFVHWIQNTVAHLPLNFAFDSKYWSPDSAGGMPTNNVYPNSMNPYGYGYTHGLNDMTEVNPEFVVSVSKFDPEIFRMYNDLLPLLDARADMDVPLWDGRGPGTNPDIDSNNDGIPDWWALRHGYDPDGPSVADEDPDGDGVTNYWEWRLGSDPHNGYSVDPSGVLNDGQVDSDGDGLTNEKEIGIFSTDPTREDTDDDGVSDWEEATGVENASYVRPVGSHPPETRTDPVNSRDPALRRSMHFDGNARLKVPSTFKYICPEWTIEMWVKPEVQQNAVLISRFVEDPMLGQHGINYEMGVSSSASAGFVRPYVRYKAIQGAGVRLDGLSPNDVVVTNAFEDLEIPVGKWTHLAGVYDATELRMYLYVNGELVAFKPGATEPPALFYITARPFQGHEVTIGAERSTGAVTSGFRGWIDNVSVQSVALTADGLMAPFFLGDSGTGNLSLKKITTQGRSFTPSAGLHSALTTLPATQPVHAMVQFKQVPTAEDLQALKAQGIEIIGEGGSLVRAVRATRKALSAASVTNRVYWAGPFMPQDKLSRQLNVTGAGGARKVLVSFFPGVSQAEALQVASSAGAVVYGNAFLKGQYMVVTANDQQLLAMVGDDRLSWTAPAADFLTSGAPVHAFDTFSLPFELVGDGWDGPGLGQADLTYFYLNTTADIGVPLQQSIVQSAMGKWSTEAAITWRKATRQGLNASVDIGYYTGDHGDDYPFDGTYGVLAHAFFPNDVNPESIAGDLHFDDAETWSVDGSGNTISLPFVALHELGHSLGMGHSSDPTAVMYPFYQAVTDPQLQPDDVAGIQSLYGPPTAVFSGSRVAYFYFNDGGLTAEDFTQGRDWLKGWENAAVLDGASFGDADWTSDKDTDGDTLPDWWEELYRLNPYDPSGEHGANGDPDGDKLVNYYEYLMGTNPRNADTDGDGISDYDEDPDGDGLTTRTEIEIYKTNPAAADSDDDGVPDGIELSQGSDPRDSLSPYVARALRFAGGSNNTVNVNYNPLLADNDRFDLTTWTVEMIVQPDRTNMTAVLLAKEVGNTGKMNYEIGLTNGLPYVRFNSAEQGLQSILVAGAMNQAVTDQRTHIAARCISATTTAGGRLDLFVNGVLVRGQDIMLRSITGPGNLRLGSAAYSGTMREVRIWNIVRSDADIEAFRDRTLFFGSLVSDAAYLRVGGTGLLKESSTTMSGDDFIDTLTDEWTLEAWIRTTGTGTVVARRNTSQPTTDFYNYYLGVADTGALIGRFTLVYTTMTTATNAPPVFTTFFNDNVNNIIGEIKVNDGKWHHVAYARDADSTRLYVDGQLDAKQARLLVPATTDPIVAAGVYAAPGPVVMGERLVGDLDEIRVWRRGLPQAELVDVNSRNLAGDEADLITYFGFDFQRGTVADERSVLRDQATEYGIYIGDAQRVVSSTDFPPIRLNPLLVYRGIALAGYFSAVDGGQTVEDFIHRMGVWPFSQEVYAGVRGTNVSFDAVLDDFDDSDGDGMPDWWESQNGFDPGSELGNDGPHADPDGDGLSNYAEYLAGTDPNNLDSSGDGFSDYDSSATPTELTWGELYTDGDGMPDAWEVLYNATAPSTGKTGLNFRKFDAGYDPDEDLWSSLAEYQGSYVEEYVDVNGVAGKRLVRSPSPLDRTQYPMPVINLRLRYNGELGSSIANVISAARPVYVNFYRTAERDGNMAGQMRMETGTLTTNTLTRGHVVEGTNYVFAFLDANNNGLWDSDWTNNYSEPAGIAAVDVGWADGTEVEVELTHESKGYWRFTWAPVPGALGYKVEFRVAGSVIYTRTVMGNDRTFFHEGDYQVGGLYGLLPATYAALVYAKQDFYGIEPDMYQTVVYRKNTNTVSAAVPPVIVTPQGTVFTEARGNVEWNMDPYATRYDIQIATTNAGGAVGATLTTVTRMRPNRDPNGNYRDSMPFYAGDTGNVGQRWLNGVYWMRIRGLSASGNTPYSAWRSIAVNVKTPETGGKSCIEGDLFYFGRVQRGNTNTVRYLSGETNLTLIVQAYRNAAFAGEPTAQVQLNAQRTSVLAGAAYELRGLPSGMYYLRAFIDLNGNRALDPFEPQDMRRVGYEPQSVDLKSSTGIRIRNQRIVIRDRDTDNDRLSDGWEFSWLGTLDYGADDTPAGDGMTLLAKYLATGVLPGLSPLSLYSYTPDVSDQDLVRMASRGADYDTDGDGMSDLHEIIYAKTSFNDANDVLRLLAQKPVTTYSSGTTESGGMKIVWQGKAGVRYAVLSTMDMVYWEVRQVFQGAGIHTFEETDATRNRQFYRVEVR